jgi:hypothetical protein
VIMIWIIVLLVVTVIAWVLLWSGGAAAVR